MQDIELKKEEAAFYFNLAIHNFQSVSGISDEQYRSISGKVKEKVKKNLEDLFANSTVLQKTENFIFNYKDTAKSARNEIETLVLKLVELRNFYSHHIHGEQVKVLSGGEKAALERYYQIAIDATGSRKEALDLFNGNKLTNAGVLFILCLFLKKAQANKLISSISGFKENGPEGQPRRNLFTYYCIREGYKIVPDMQKHFLLFALINHLIHQEKLILEKQAQDDFGEGLFFQRMAATFLNISGLLKDMKFYTYQSRRLDEQRGKVQSSKEIFVWIEPFQGNSYFTIGKHKGVIGEDQLKELCYALLIEKRNIQEVEGKIYQFFERFKAVNSKQDAEKDPVLRPEYFPAHYFGPTETGNLKGRLIRRLEQRFGDSASQPLKTYDKMREVADFINSCLPPDEKMRQKDYRRYLKMIRFWDKEKENIIREFDNKKWKRYLPREFWEKRDIEEVYLYAKEQNDERTRRLCDQIKRLNESEFEKHQKISQAGDIETLRMLCRDYRLPWEEKDWDEYSRPITDRQKLTIMRQRATAALKERQGIRGLNLRLSQDSNKSRQAVMNRIALPVGFVREHILGTREKISKKIRGSPCLIELSKRYRGLSERCLERRDLNTLTAINGLLEKNTLIAFMVLHLMDDPGFKIDRPLSVYELKERKIPYKITERVTVEIPLAHYPSLAYAISRRYLDRVDQYPFPEAERAKSLLEKIDFIEKGRFEYIRQVLGFEKYLFDNKIIDRDNFSSFEEICGGLVKKGWDKDILNQIRNARNNALHGDIPDRITFYRAGVLIKSLKNDLCRTTQGVRSDVFERQKSRKGFERKNLRDNRCDDLRFGRE